MSNKSRAQRNNRAQGNTRDMTPDNFYGNNAEDETPAVEFQPRKFSSTKTTADAERETVFWVDDTEYTIPTKLPASVAVQALRIMAQQGVMAGTFHMVKTALGEEAVQILENLEDPAFDLEWLRGLFSKIGEKYFGQLEELTGK